MKIHEYQAKSVLARFGVTVPRGEVAFTSLEAGEIARRLGGSIAVVKAQIHAGGRGKGGGVKIAKSADEAEQLAKQILGMTLVTHQTGPEGRKVGRVLIEEGLQIERELYLSIVIDRASASPVIIASASGGMDIEEVAAKEPEKILREKIDPGTGVIPFQARKLAFGMRLGAGPANKLVKILDSIYKAFIETDASMIEINPLILTKGGDLLALDAKVSFDTTPCIGIPIFAICAISARRIRSKSKRRSSRSTTFASTATSAAWSTARVLPWRRWTSSSWREGNRQTSSTWAVVRTRSKSRTPSAS